MGSVGFGGGVSGAIADGWMNTRRPGSQRPYPISTRILDFGETYDCKLPEHQKTNAPPPYVSDLRGLRVTSDTDRQATMDAEIDAVIEQRFAATLKTGRPGVKLGTLGFTL